MPKSQLVYSTEEILTPESADADYYSVEQWCQAQGLKWYWVWSGSREINGVNYPVAIGFRRPRDFRFFCQYWSQQQTVWN